VVRAPRDDGGLLWLELKELSREVGGGRPLIDTARTLGAKGTWVMRFEVGTSVERVLAARVTDHAVRCCPANLSSDAAFPRSLSYGRLHVEDVHSFCLTSLTSPMFGFLTRSTWLTFFAISYGPHSLIGHSNSVVFHRTQAMTSNVTMQPCLPMPQQTLVPCCPGVYLD
jgi:hypothetical protein